MATRKFLNCICRLHEFLLDRAILSISSMSCLLFCSEFCFVPPVLFRARPSIQGLFHKYLECELIELMIDVLVSTVPNKYILNGEMNLQSSSCSRGLILLYDSHQLLHQHLWCQALTF